MCYIIKLMLSDMEATVAWKTATSRWIQVWRSSWMRLCATSRQAVGSITYITVAQLDEALRYKAAGRGFDYLH